MKRFLTGASQAEGPDGLGSMWQWFITGALTFGIAPVSVQAQDMMGSMRIGSNLNALGSSPMRSGTRGAVAGYGGQGDGEMGNGKPGTGQSAPIAPATLFGLPAENGRLQWPLGIQLLPPTNETKALREQLELVLYFVATQAAEGRVNRTLIDFGLQAVGDLRELMRPRERTMPATTYTEAMRFLDRAERGLTKIKMIETSPNGAYP